jgi:hypothetical protein
MSEDIILALILFGVMGICGIVSLTSSRREKTEEHIV